MEQRLCNILESLRILRMSELLPQAGLEDKYATYERACLKRCLETCTRIFTNIDQHKGADDRTAASMKECQEDLSATISQQKEGLEAIDKESVEA